MAAPEVVILLASVKVDNMEVSKAFRCDKTTTVVQAIQHISQKCSLVWDEEDIRSSYVIYIYQEDGEGIYLTEPDELLLEARVFKDRDPIQVRKVIPFITLASESSDVPEKKILKVDLEQSGKTFYNTICKNEFYTPYQWDLIFTNEEKDTKLDMNRTLQEQGITHTTTLYLRHKKQRGRKRFGKKSKGTLPSPRSISGPMHVRHSQDDALFRPDNSLGSRIFGFPLQRALEHPTLDLDVPLLVSAACTFILEHALQEQGIFRISAKSDLVDGLKEQFDDNSVDVQFVEGDDPHLVCSIFKQYLRDLPESVIPLVSFHDFLDLYDIHGENIEAMKTSIIPLVQRLPRANFVLLRKLCLLLQEISRHQKQNKMGPKNLATVFGPNLLRSENDDDVQVLMINTSRINTITTALISFADHIFDEGVDKKEIRKNTPRLKKGKAMSTEIVGYTTAIYNYAASNTCEISFSKGDHIAIISFQESGWHIGCIVNSKAAGFFPSNYCSDVVTALVSLEAGATQTPELMATEIEILKKQLQTQKEETRRAKEESTKLLNFTTTQLERFASLLENNKV